MYVNIPGYGRNKINAAFALGGAPLAVWTLANLTGVPMDHVALTDFEGFIRLTEDLHGVTVIKKNVFTSHGFQNPQGQDHQRRGGSSLVRPRAQIAARWRS